MGGNVFPPIVGGKSKTCPPIQMGGNTHNININVYHISMLYLGGLLG